MCVICMCDLCFLYCMLSHQVTSRLASSLWAVTPCTTCCADMLLQSIVAQSYIIIHESYDIARYLNLMLICQPNVFHVCRLLIGCPSVYMTIFLWLQPTCDNHDDGDTLAIILCGECGNLCADCDRFLHLHRRMRQHQRQVRLSS